jgi:hypothetical protein
VNVSTLEEEGISVSTTGEAIALTSLMSTVALIVLFGSGFVATTGRHLPHAYLITAGIALILVAAALAAVLAVLGYRLVNYWLPLLPGAVAYLRLRLKQRKKNLPNGPGSTSAFNVPTRPAS